MAHYYAGDGDVAVPLGLSAWIITDRSLTAWAMQFVDFEIETRIQIRRLSGPPKCWLLV
jgi:hypothetical protein